MSRGFWTVIGTIVGLFAGGWTGVALAHARFNCCYGESGYPIAGQVLGVVIGGVVAWNLANRRRDHK